MKPIRIYSDPNVHYADSSHYIWMGGTVCCGGGGCISGCIFLDEGRDTYLALPTMDQIVKSFRPSRGYVELTPDSHPEVFL